VRHHRPDAYSAEQVLLNKRQIYGGAPKLHWYPFLQLGTFFLYICDPATVTVQTSSATRDLMIQMCFGGACLHCYPSVQVSDQYSP